MISMVEVAKEVHLRVDQEPEAGVPPLTRSGALELVRAVFDIMEQAILSGESIAIPKFGKFNTVVKAARKGRNPKTGETINIPERMTLKFRPSIAMRTQLSEMKVIKKEKAVKSKPKAKEVPAKKKKK